MPLRGPDESILESQDFLTSPNLLSAPPSFHNDNVFTLPKPPVPIEEEHLAAPLQLPPHDEPKDSMIWNYLCRWLENSKFLGALPRAAVNYHEEEGLKNFDELYAIDYDIQFGTMVGNGFGVLTAIAFHVAFKYGKKYRAKVSLNPFYRNFKTLSSLGLPAAMLLANVLPFLPKGSVKIFTAIFADVLAITFGLLAFPYWLYREYWLKTHHEHRNVYAKVGIEGWSKYAKTAIVWGLGLGQCIGAIYALVSGHNILYSLSVFGGIASLTCFVGSLIVIPLINRYFNSVLISKEKDRDVARNNYVRAFITLGLALGAIIGYVFLSGLGIGPGMLVGAAFTSTVFGVIGGLFGRRISQYTQTYWHVAKSTDNSWDFAARNTSYACAFLFSIIGFFLPLPGGTLIGAALGSAVGGVIGWFMGFLIIKKAREIELIEQPAKTVPWTQLSANFGNVFSMVFGALGFVTAMLINPLLALEGATLGFAIGGFVGSVIAALLNKTVRKFLGLCTDMPLSNAPAPDVPIFIQPDEPVIGPKPDHHPEETGEEKAEEEFDDEKEVDERNDAEYAPAHDNTESTVVTLHAEPDSQEDAVTKTEKIEIFYEVIDPSVKHSPNRYRLFQSAGNDKKTTELSYEVVQPPKPAKPHYRLFDTVASNDIGEKSLSSPLLASPYTSTLVCSA